MAAIVSHDVGCPRNGVDIGWVVGDDCYYSIERHIWSMYLFSVYALNAFMQLGVHVVYG
jgi:hypothetical protein